MLKMFKLITIISFLPFSLSVLAQGYDCAINAPPPELAEFPQNDCESMVDEGYSCYLAWEKKQIDKYPKDVSRADKILTVKTDYNGRISMVFKSNPVTAETFTAFWFMGKLNITDQLVVSASYTESEEYYFISPRRSGNVITLKGLPVFSPDSKHLAISDRGGEESRTYLEIWQIQDDSLINVFSLEPIKVYLGEPTWWGPGKINWLSPTSLAVNKCDENYNNVGTIHLELHEGKWNISN